MFIHKGNFQLQDKCVKVVHVHHFSVCACVHSAWQVLVLTDDHVSSSLYTVCVCVRACVFVCVCVCLCV